MKFYKVCNNARLTSIFAIVIAIGFSSCKKQEVAEASQSLVSVYNFSPTVATYDIYLGDTKLNSVAIPFGGGVKYQTIQPGTYTMNYKTAGTATTIFSKAATYQNAVNGSLYLVGKNAATFDLVYVNDASQAAATDKAYVRFVNLCADAPAMDLTTASSTTITTNKAYKTNSGFVEVTPGSFTFNVKETTSGTQKTQVTGTLVAASFYTVAFGGNYAPANDNERPVSAFIIRHQ